MSKELPGYADHKAEIEAAKKALEAKMAEKKQQEQDNMAQKAQKKVLAQKLRVVAKYSDIKKHNAFTAFLKEFATVQAVSFIIGSVAFLGGKVLDREYVPMDERDIHTGYVAPIYGGSMSYSQAIKNAYLLDDWRHGNRGVFQGICGLLSLFLAYGFGTSEFKKQKKSDEKKYGEILAQLESLKDYGIDVPQLIQNLTPNMEKLISKMSEKDRGYFDNLVAGGLDKANYETCVAIVSGYLKSHPDEYNKVIEIIDEATLPETIKKKYGKGKTISFAAAQEMHKSNR